MTSGKWLNFSERQLSLLQNMVNSHTYITDLLGGLKIYLANSKGLMSFSHCFIVWALLLDKEKLCVKLICPCLNSEQQSPLQP